MKPITFICAFQFNRLVSGISIQKLVVVNPFATCFCSRRSKIDSQDRNINKYEYAVCGLFLGLRRYINVSSVQ